MDSTYGEFQGTDLDPSADWDFDEDFEDEGNDLLPIIGASALLAAVEGGIHMATRRKRNPIQNDKIQEVMDRMEKRGKKGAAQLEKRGKKGVQSVQHAVGNGKLGDLLDDAVVYARHRADDASHAVDQSKLSDLLDDALSKARKAAARADVQDTATDLSKSVSKGVRQGLKKAQREMRDLAASDTVQGGLSRARSAAGRIDVGDMARDARQRAQDAVENVRDTDIDARGTLGSLRDRVSQVVDTVREDPAPRAADAAKEAGGR